MKKLTYNINIKKKVLQSVFSAVLKNVEECRKKVDKKKEML